MASKLTDSSKFKVTVKSVTDILALLFCLFFFICLFCSFSFFFLIFYHFFFFFFFFFCLLYLFCLILFLFIKLRTCNSIYILTRAQDSQASREEGAQWNQDNSSTEQFVDTFFETNRRQIVRQSSTLLLKVN